MRSDIQHRLAEWQRAGLLSAQQAAAIAAFEQESAQHSARPYAFYAIGGLGALAVAIGLISLVASNWQDIPPSVKLLFDLLLGVGLAVAAVCAEASSSRFVREVLLLVFFGYVLASIGLTGQVYQLGGEAHEAMLLWCVITFAAMLHLRTGLGAAVWLVALEATWLMNGFQLIDKLGSRKDESLLFITLWFVTAMLLVLVGGAAPVRARRPALAQTAFLLGALQSLGMMALAPQVFYIRINDSVAVAPLVFFVCVAVALVVAVRVPALLSALTGRAPEASAVLSLRVLVIYGTLLSCFTALVPHGSMQLLGALSFLLLFALVGWVGYAARSYPLFQIATGILAVRVLIVYFEVIGSMLGSGLGLILGGALTLWVAWYWRKKTVQLHGAFAAELPHEEVGPDSPPADPQGGAS